MSYVLVRRNTSCEIFEGFFQRVHRRTSIEWAIDSAVAPIQYTHHTMYVARCKPSVYYLDGKPIRPPIIQLGPLSDQLWAIRQLDG